MKRRCSGATGQNRRPTVEEAILPAFAIKQAVLVEKDRCSTRDECGVKGVVCRVIAWHILQFGVLQPSIDKSLHTSCELSPYRQICVAGDPIGNENIVMGQTVSFAPPLLTHL